MEKSFVAIWFPHLITDWFTVRQPALKNTSFVLASPIHGRMVITATNAHAVQQGIYAGMVLADARAVFPDLYMKDNVPDMGGKLLLRIAEWCIRFTPVVAVDEPDGLLLDVSGCTHLWGGNDAYLTYIQQKINERGYAIRIAMASTIGAAWALAHYGANRSVVHSCLVHALSLLPAAALRLEEKNIDKLNKLGLQHIGSFIHMPRATLRRRFGEQFITRLHQALGLAPETLQPVQPVIPYSERLPCLEPIVTAAGIAIALQQLLHTLCTRLQKENRGLRNAVFKGFRLDGKVVQLSIGTNRPSNSVIHLFKLFENKIQELAPDLGIELFVLEASMIQDHYPVQEKCWESASGLSDLRLAELFDRIAGKLGSATITRFLPVAHYWPERSIKAITTITEQPVINWPTHKPRPLVLLDPPHSIEVTAPIPDYPPMLFRYKGQLHKIVKADGPERIEQEWWLQQGQHRDYYYVENEEGNRYWLFRLGHYNTKKTYQWFIHGFFT